VFAFLPAGFQVFTDSPHFDEGRAHLKKAVKTGAIPHEKTPGPHDTIESTSPFVMMITLR
jgi:hypothetical protein